jgi:site-specific DNA-methyltransferase (adenine-specific)
MTNLNLTAANHNAPTLEGLYREIDAVFPDLFTPAERALRMASAKAHHERLFPLSKAGARQGLGSKHGSGQNPAPDAFVTMVVERAKGRRGWSESSIKQVVLRGNHIRRDVLDAIIANGKFDKGDRLDLLAKTPAALQMEEFLSWSMPTPPPVPNGQVFEPTSNLRLECADAEVRLWELVGDSELYDFVCTDWPYGIEYVSRSEQRVWGDDKLPLWYLEPLRRLVKPNGCMALWAGAESLYDACCALTEAGFAMTIIRWDKIHPVMKGRECVILASVGRPPNLDVIRHESLPGTHRLQKAHATPKPPEVMLPLISALCPPGGRVLDPFMGTCPVGVAAQQLGRRYHGLEIVPKHFATACAEMTTAVADSGPALRVAA